MSPATAKRPKNAPPPTLEEAAAARLREDLEQYREQVADAADGGEFHGPQLERVAALLERLGLPRYAWQRDIDSLKLHRKLAADVETLEAGRQADADEANVLTTEIKHVERRLTQARSRLHELTVVRPQTITGLYQRLHELAVGHPHTLGDIDKAVAMKLAAQQREAERAPKTGWLP